MHLLAFLFHFCVIFVMLTFAYSRSSWYGGIVAGFGWGLCSSLTFLPLVAAVERRYFCGLLVAWSFRRCFSPRGFVRRQWFDRRGQLGGVFLLISRV